MQKKKEKLLGKIVKKNYNNRLEAVLEKKNVSEHTKSILLSIFYKIESAYPDYKMVKRNVESKDEYIENIISIIERYCDSIDVISPTSPRSQELGRRVFLIDKQRNSIKCYPVERKILYAISKIGKAEYILDKEKYEVYAKPVSELINVGSNINTVEPLRDFNGYSWTTISNEIESIEHNLIYQNMRMLVGYQFLNEWVKNDDYAVDYMNLFRKYLRNFYGQACSNAISETIIQIAIYLDEKFNKEDPIKLDESEEEILKLLGIIHDKKLFTENIFSKKRTISEKIKNIDTILNNQALLQSEFEKRNYYLPADKKIRNLNDLEIQLTNERENEFSKIEKLNKLLLPTNFINYQKQLEEKGKYLKLVKADKSQADLNGLIINLQIIFLRCFASRIKYAKSKSDVEDLLYEFRYYNLLNFSKQQLIRDIEELQNELQKTLSVLIYRMKEEGITGEFSAISEIENRIFSAILSIKTINLNDVNVEIRKENESVYLYIYDEEDFETKIEIGKSNQIQKNDLGIKFNKKVKVFY